jgi:hypothetical protein
MHINLIIDTQISQKLFCSNPKQIIEKCPRDYFHELEDAK